jgi:hypothetical protein
MKRKRVTENPMPVSSESCRIPLYDRSSLLDPWGTVKDVFYGAQEEGRDGDHVAEVLAAMTGTESPMVQEARRRYNAHKSSRGTDPRTGIPYRPADA